MLAALGHVDGSAAALHRRNDKRHRAEDDHGPDDEGQYRLPRAGKAGKFPRHRAPLYRAVGGAGSKPRMIPRFEHGTKSKRGARPETAHPHCNLLAPRPPKRRQTLYDAEAPGAGEAARSRSSAAFLRTSGSASLSASRFDFATEIISLMRLSWFTSDEPGS